MKTFVKGFVWVTGILLLLLVLVTSIAYWQKDKLINYVLGDINQQLQSKINIASIDFNVIKHFPNTSLVLNKVYAAPAKPFLQSDTLLAADKIYLLFDILQLINGKYQLKKVVIESAIIKLQIEKRGLRNFDIWKSDNAPAKSNLNLQFKEVLLKQTAFVFDDFKQTTHYNAYFNNAQLQGNFSEKQFEVKAKANLWLHQLQVAGIHLNQSRQAMLDCNIKVNRNQNEITFLPSQIKIEGIDLGIAGKLKFLNDTTQYGLTLNGNQIDLIALASVWPVVAKTTNQYSASGLVSFKATINGYQTIKTKPKIEAHFSADNAALKASNDAQLTHISFNGFYSNSYNGVDLLTLNKVSCQLNAQPLTGAFTVSNFKTPAIKATINGLFDLQKLSSFYKPDTIKSITGMAAINVTCQGSLNDANTYLSNGSIKISNASLIFKNSPTTINNINAMCYLSDNDLQVQLLAGTIGISDFKFTGSVTNAFSYLLNQQTVLQMDAVLKSNVLNLNDFVFTQSKGSAGIHFSDKLNCTLNISVGKLTYNKFEGKKLIGTVTLAESAFTAESLSIETLDGTIKANGQIDASQPDLQIALHANFDHIDATKTFYAFNNFGQNALTADNIKGEITAQVQLTSTWTKQLVLENNSLYSNCKIKITNGALINFKPMMSLGRYLKEADLNKVTFDTLNNTIEIKNGTIYIPLMHINSSALKLKASGSHTFDNMVDYHIQLGLSQLLNKKIVNNQTEFGQIEDDGLGNWQLYLKMTGNIKDPKFAYDKKSVKQHISKQVATEKQTVKDLFKKEFGWFKGDSTQAKNPKPQKQKEAVQIDYDDE